MKLKITERVGDIEVTKNFQGEVEEILAIYLEVFKEQEVVKEQQAVKDSGFNLEGALKCRIK